MKTNLPLTRRATPDREDAPAECLIVMYHYVRARGSAESGGVCGLDPRRFEDQLDALASWGEPIPWTAFLAAVASGGPMPRRSFLLTFDDGLRDHIEVVAPILGERGLRGVFFVPGGVLEGARMCAAHQVHLLLNVLSDESLTHAVASRVSGWESAEGLPEETELARYGYEKPARARLKHLLHHQLPFEQRDQILDALFREYVGDPAVWIRKWYLSADDVQALNAAGHVIGGHGYRHEPLARLSDTAIAEEVTRSAAVLDHLLGAYPRPLSYPFGSVDDRGVAAARRAGFAAGFTTRSALAVRGDEGYRLPRVDTIHVTSLIERSVACRS